MNWILWAAVAFAVLSVVATVSIAYFGKGSASVDDYGAVIGGALVGGILLIVAAVLVVVGLVAKLF